MSVRSTRTARARCHCCRRACWTLEQSRSRRQEQAAEAKKLLVGSGDRSERIRTYNYPQGRVTDHRINLTLYKLDEVLQGNLALVIEPLTSEHQAAQLATLEQH